MQEQIKSLSERVVSLEYENKLLKQENKHIKKLYDKTRKDTNKGNQRTSHNLPRSSTGMRLLFEYLKWSWSNLIIFKTSVYLDKDLTEAANILKPNLLLSSNDEEQLFWKTEWNNSYSRQNTKHQTIKFPWK